jgi:hypothetical protein
MKNVFFYFELFKFASFYRIFFIEVLEESELFIDKKCAEYPQENFISTILP